MTTELALMSEDDLYFYVDWVLVGALIVATIATYAIVVVSRKIRDRVLWQEIAIARTAEAELALAKFRTLRLRTPRHELLTPQARASIVEKLRPFAGTRFDVGHDREDREVSVFLWNFEPLLTAAGWVHVDWSGGERFRKTIGWPGDHWCGVANVNDVSVEVRPIAGAALMAAAQALSEALRAIGIEARSGDNNNSSQNDDVIHLLVGP